MREAIITTGRKFNKNSLELALEYSSKLNIPFVERQNVAIEKILEIQKAKLALVAKKNSLRIVSSDSEIFFHPSLAHLRIKNLKNGQGDRMIEAMNLKRGMKVLDCTLGLGADSIVESFIVGEEGEVTALEVNPYLAAVVSYGFQNFSEDNSQVIQSMRKIQVVNTNYLEFLKKTEYHSYDVVYFDPMFRHPLERSSSLNPLREVADHSAVTIEAIQEACRVAKYRVVLKENAKSLEFERLGFEKIFGGRYSPVHYGVIINNE